MFDVCVIGCGVIGAFVSRELSRYDLKICILEAASDVCMGASKANSGIVHAGFDAMPGTLKARFNVEGNKMMKDVCDELGVKYVNNGSLVLGFTKEDVQHLKELYDRGVQNGVEGLKLLSTEEALKLEPCVSENIAGALYAPTGGIVCPYGLTIAACGNAMDNGAELKLDFNVVDIQKSDGAYVVKSSDTREVYARYIVNAAGVHSDDIAKLLGDNSFEITARAGEYMLLDKEFGGICKSTVFQVPTRLGKGVLVSPTVDGNIILGPTSVVRDDKGDVSTTQEGFCEIVAKIGLSSSKLPYRGVITSFAGVRAVGSTGDFIIKCENNCVTLAGIESPGLTSAPAIGKYVVKLLSENGLKLVAKASFEPKRVSAHAFRELSIEEKNEVIKAHPEYGKIVCRCEQVSLGEILDALGTNPKARDVDGIKRRTRSGMGRCQGGFCLPAITEIIAKEYGIPMHEVTKSGKDAYLNVGFTKEDK